MPRATRSFSISPMRSLVQLCSSLPNGVDLPQPRWSKKTMRHLDASSTSAHLRFIAPPGPPWTTSITGASLGPCARQYIAWPSPTSSRPSSNAGAGSTAGLAAAPFVKSPFTSLFASSVIATPLKRDRCLSDCHRAGSTGRTPAEFGAVFGTCAAAHAILRVSHAGLTRRAGSPYPRTLCIPPHSFAPFYHRPFLNASNLRQVAIRDLPAWQRYGVVDPDSASVSVRRPQRPLLARQTMVPRDGQDDAPDHGRIVFGRRAGEPPE